MNEVSRRGFLVASTATVALILAPAPVSAQTPASGSDDDVLADREGLRALGRRALEDGHPRNLTQTIEGLDAASLRTRIADDLAARRVLVVGGWTLAATEVALCIREHLRHV